MKKSKIGLNIVIAMLLAVIAVSILMLSIENMNQ